MDAGRVVGMTYPPETRPGSCAGRRFREEVRNEQETTHAGADHHGASGGRSRSGEGQDGEDGDPGARDLLAVAEGVRGDEGGPGASIQGAAERERTTEASGGKPDAGQADPGGSGQGKLLSPERRHRCVVQVRQRLGATDVVRLASRFGRYGYRQITNLLRIEGWQVNYKRVERIWRQEGLKVPRRQPKRGRLWLGDGSCIRLRPLQ